MLYLLYENFKTINFYNLFLSYLNNLKLNFSINFIISFFYFYYYFAEILLIFLLLISIVSINFVKKFIVLLDFYIGYYKIHPLLFYVSAHYIFFYNSNNKTNINISFILVITMVAFFLGSLWALYQNIWGYYWSNDSIEYILCFFFWLTLCYQHQFFKNQSLFKFLLFYFILLLVTMLRLNFIYTKHNFFKLSSNYDNYFVVMIFFFLFNLLFFKNNSNLKKNYSINNYLTLIFLILIIFIILNIINTYTIAFIFYFFFSKVLLFMVFIFFNFNYKNYAVHLFVFIGLLCYNNYNIQYFISYNNLKVINWKSNNLYFKHLLQSSYFNKYKNNINISDSNWIVNKFINNIKNYSFKMKYLTQKLVNYI